MATRREIIKSAPLGLIAANMIPIKANARQTAVQGRILIMIELKGGNDGLNTVIPYSDPLYKKFRPTIAIQENEIIKINDSLGLNPALNDIAGIYKDNQCAIVVGTGYEKPNKSHFRSIDIWHTASDSQENLDDGWLAKLFAENNTPENYMTDGIILGQGDAGPLRAKNYKVKNIVMKDPKEFLEKGKDARKKNNLQKHNKDAITHILGIENDIAKAVDVLKQKLSQSSETEYNFPNTNIGQQMMTTAKLISANVPFAVIKVAQGGYDTHSMQINRHQQLLTQLNDAIAAFKKEMQHIKKWDDILIMTYSEFGRRIKENGSMGTDHGTAAPHFFIGGKVKGGIYGEQPQLKNAKNGDLQFTMDYRCMYETVAKDWFKIQGQFQKKNLQCINNTTL